MFLQTAVCQPEQPEGHQLGQLSVATADPGPLLSVLAGEDSVGAGAAPGSSDRCTADKQAGGAVEGMQPTLLQDNMLVGLAVRNSSAFAAVLCVYGDSFFFLNFAPGQSQCYLRRPGETWSGRGTTACAPALRGCLPVPKHLWPSG